MTAPHSMNLSELVSAQAPAGRSRRPALAAEDSSAERSCPRRPKRYGTPDMERSAPSARARATATVSTSGTPGPRASSCACQSSARAATSPSGSRGAAGALKQAPVGVIAKSYLLGVSTGRLERLCCAMGIDQISGEPGLRDGQSPGGGGGGLPQPSAGSRAIPLLLGRCAGLPRARGGRRSGSSTF